MESLDAVPKKRGQKIQVVILYLLSVVVATLLICVFLLGIKLSKNNAKVEKTEADLALVKKQSQFLSDSLSTLTILVKDTMYSVLVSQQSYIAEFSGKLKNVSTSLSFVDTRLKKVDKSLEAIKSMQASFVGNLNDVRNDTRTRYDSLEVKFKTPLILPPPTDTNKVLVVETKTAPVANKTKKRKLFKKKSSSSSASNPPGW